MSDNPADSLRRELETAAINESHRHEPDHERGGCTCGFCAYSVEHVVIMSVREGARRSVSAGLEAARADGEKQGRNNAARDIEAHRAKWAPMDGNMDQRRLSRHLGIAARVAQGPIDIEDVRVAFERAVSDGN